MYRSKLRFVSVGTLLVILALLVPARGQALREGNTQHKSFDPVEFINGFKLGMTYAEVQAGLPKDAEQEVMFYFVTDEVFVLNVDGKAPEDWGASFKFDTTDETLRRPERLVEVEFSASLSSRVDSFESLMRKANRVFGTPVEVEGLQENLRQAGWRVPGGSILRLEYSTTPDRMNGKDVNVEFVLKKKRRHDPDPLRSIA